MWHDDHLLRDGAMSAMDVESLVKFWESKGLSAMRSVNGQEVWDDLCVVNALSVVPTAPCEWIEVSEDGTHAWLKGSDPCAIVGPSYDLSTESVVADDHEEDE